MHAGLDAATLADIDLLTPNETEMAELLARFGVGHVEAKTLRDLADAELAALCARLPVRAVLITLGDAGAFLAPGASSDLTRATLVRAPAATVRAIDTTGAGDAFNGALAAAWAERAEADPATLLPFAIRFAGLSTERAGAAAAMPNRDEVVARFGP
jgi:ribokinase